MTVTDVAAPTGLAAAGPRLRIGLVSPYGYPQPGGVNEHVRYTAAALRELGHSVTILTSKAGRTRASGDDVIRIGTGWGVPANGSMGVVTFGTNLRRDARAVLAEHDFDILHFHEPFVPFLSPALLRESQTVNVATFHAFGGFSPSYWLGRYAARPLAARLHGRIAVSGAARHFINRYFPGDYRIIPNGVDIDRFALAEPLEEYRDGVLNILFVGRLEDRKGLIHLLRAHQRIRKRHVDARLLVIGNGPRRREYRRFVATRRIPDVEFLGRVDDETKARFFASADIFCAPATGQESFGIVLLEAMAAGLPIVASDIHGYKNVVQRNQQALLVEPRNHRALAAALYALSRDADLRHRMGESGRDRAPEYDWVHVTARLVEFYHEVRRAVAAGQGT